eukprot:COSAG02_NODE_5_length_66751_cov_63.939148_21_plen_479_part_00
MYRRPRAKMDGWPRADATPIIGMRMHGMLARADAAAMAMMAPSWANFAAVALVLVTESGPQLPLKPMDDGARRDLEMLLPPAAAVRARLKVDDDDLVWNEDPRAWHQQSARTVLHRFSTFQNFQQFARESKQAGVSMLMLMRVQKVDACPGPWYGGLQMCEHINGSFPAADGTLEEWQALLKEIKPMRLGWWWEPVVWSVQGPVWEAAAADPFSDVGQWFSWNATDRDICMGYNPCANNLTCKVSSKPGKNGQGPDGISPFLHCAGPGCAQGTWGSEGPWNKRSIKAALSSFGSPSFSSYLVDAMANSWTRNLGIDAYTFDVAGDYHPDSHGRCPSGMLQTGPSGQSLPALAKIIENARAEQPQIVVSGEKYSSWNEVMLANADVGGQGFPAYHAAMHEAVASGDATQLEGNASTSGADAATVLCYMHPYYDGRQPGGCPTMYFRDQTATYKNVSQHNMCALRSIASQSIEFYHCCFA